MDEADNVMSPMSYLKIFFRRKELVIIPAFIGLIIGICAGIVLPKQYESSTTILVEEGKTDNPLFDKLTVSTSVQQRLSVIRESMLGWNSLVKLVKRLEMDKTVNSPREFEELILGIRSNIVIKMRGANIIHLSYFDSEPEITRDVVKNITDIFLERNVDIQNQETSDAITFIEGQLDVYRGKIKSAEIAKLKDSLKVLLVDSTEDHPQVKQLRDQIKIKTDELAAQNLAYTEDVLADSNTNNSIIQEIQTALTSVEKSDQAVVPANAGVKDGYYKVMLMDKLNKVMARDGKVNSRIYSMLLQRLETARITQDLQSSKEGTKYNILDPARIALEPSKPDVVLVTVGGLIGGLIFGIGLVLAFEFLDKSFIDVEEAKQFLGTPLLGAISKINTELSVKKEREKQSWLYSLMVVAGVIVVILTTAMTNFLQ